MALLVVFRLGLLPPLHNSAFHPAIKPAVKRELSREEVGAMGKHIRTLILGAFPVEPLG